MAFLEFRNVRIAGFSAGVPKNISVNEFVASKDYDAADFVATTGVYERRIGDFTTSDLCFEASERLLIDLQWKKEEIGALIFVSQTPDYILPATACILQNRLGLSKECYALDVSLGCSGWVYGLSVIAGLLSKNGISKALLLVGDAKKRAKSDPDPLFGHAGTVTAVEYCEGASGFKFHVGTDGSGYDAIITPDGGSRNQFSEESLKLVQGEDGIMRHRLQTVMKGMDVFAFGITVVPKTVKKLLEKYQVDINSIDYFIFHQANKMMNEKIRKKLKLPEEKVPYCMHDFGNTSSASIPLTIVTQIADMVRTRALHHMACGFGVGLSWATVLFDTDHIVVSELVEV